MSYRASRHIESLFLKDWSQPIETHRALEKDGEVMFNSFPAMYLFKVVSHPANLASRSLTSVLLNPPLHLLYWKRVIGSGNSIIEYKLWTFNILQVMWKISLMCWKLLAFSVIFLNGSASYFGCSKILERIKYRVYIVSFQYPMWYM